MRIGRCIGICPLLEAGVRQKNLVPGDTGLVLCLDILFDTKNHFNTHTSYALSTLLSSHYKKNYTKYT